jgi:integral membrane protein
MLRTPIGRLRLTGMVEGLSFLILLFVAMPKKYIGGDPTWVSSVGMVHGVLFVVFCWTLLSVWSNEEWSVKQLALPFFASLIPFGPFLIDGRLKRLEAPSGLGSDSLPTERTSDEND